MADARTARLTAARPVGPETRLLDFELTGGEALGFVGGQYVIINTGVPLPGGKVAKRAYSLLSADAEQRRFQIAVRRIGPGPGSNFMHTVAVGTELSFSGPWGKYLVDPAAPPGPTLAVATDTGITAALGLLRSERFRPWLPLTQLLWLVESPDYFLPWPLVREWLPGPCGRAELRMIPPVHHSERPAAARAAVTPMQDESPPAHAFLSGDGTILYALQQDLTAAGLAEDRIRLECFFNNPFRKAP